MRVRRLKIRNFRAHEKSYVEFSDGINLIIGQNGAGKSSILEAIFAALYLGHGSFPRGYKDLNIRMGTKGFELSLEFEHGGKNYEIVRKSAGESYLKENGHILADKDSDIARWVERHLYPIHVYKNALYIRQGEIESILTDESIREKVLRKVLGIEDYENAEKNAQETIKELRREKGHLEGIIQGAGDVKAQIEESEKKLKEIFKAINELKKAEKEIKEKFRGVSSRYNELKERKERIDALEKEKLKIEGEVKEIREGLKQLNERIKELQKEIAELKKREKRLKDIKWVGEEYQKLRNLLLKNDEVQKAKMDLSKLKQELKGIDEQIKELEGREKELREKTLEYEEKVKLYRELKPLVEEYERAKQLLAEKDKYEKELERAGYTRESLLKDLEKIERAKKRLNEVEEEIAKIREEVGGMKRLEEQLKENLSKLEGVRECPLCKRPIEEHDEEEIREEYEREFEKIGKQRINLEKKLERLTKEKTKLEKERQRERKLIRIQKTLEYLEKVEKELESYDIKTLEAKSREFDEVKNAAIGLKKEMDGLKKDVEKLESLKLRKRSIGESIREVNSKIETIMEELSKKGFPSFEEVKKRMEEIEPLHREYIQLKGVPSEIELKEKRLEKLEKEKAMKSGRAKELKEKLEEITKELTALEKEFSEEEFKEVEKEHFELSKEIPRVKAEIKGQEHLKEEITKHLEELRGKLKEVEKARERIKLIDKIMGDMKVLREKLIKFKAEAERRGLEEVEKLASELFSDMTERKYQGIKIIRKKIYGKERIRIGVLYQGEEKDVEFLSGGERIALGLSFRLALSIYKVRNMELLILDEPTPFLDEERRKKLIDIISQHLRKIPQVLIVSHDEELKDAADYVIRVALVGGKSNVEVESLAAY